VRLPALDAARTLGVVAMVVGHALDALLSPAARAGPGVALYWQARGFTAPLFLVVAGWALAAAATRPGLRGPSALLSRLPRVALLAGLGLALRWPGWAREGILHLEPEPWRHLLAFDVLHTLAAGLLVSAAVLALPLGRGRAAGAFALLALATLVAAWSVPGATRPAGLAAIALEQAVGGTSPFPLLPWLVYLFAGAGLGLLARDGGRRTALAVAAAGAGLVLPFAILHPGDFAPAHPVLVGLRLGAVLLLLALLFAIPARAARAVAPIGRASLAVYAIHLPVVYGWSTVPGLAARAGPSMDLAPALAAAVVVLAASLAGARLLAAARGAAGPLLRRGSEAAACAARLLGSSAAGRTR
jgi:uncharacterized membrane protein